MGSHKYSAAQKKVRQKNPTLSLLSASSRKWKDISKNFLDLQILHLNKMKAVVALALVVSLFVFFESSSAFMARGSLRSRGGGAGSYARPGWLRRQGRADIDANYGDSLEYIYDDANDDLPEYLKMKRSALSSLRRQGFVHH